MRHGMTKRMASAQGQTLVDFLVAVSIFGVLASSALPHFDPRRQDVNTVLATLQGDFRITRAKAIATGTHFSVNMASVSKFEVRRHREDGNTWPVDTVINTVQLPDTVLFWMHPSTLEFNTRGMMITQIGGEPWPVYVYVYDKVGSRLHAFSVWPSGQVNEEF